MIDSIHFSVKDLSFHQELASWLNKGRLGIGVTQKGMEIDPENVEDIKKQILFKDYTVFHESGNEIEKTYFAKLKSHHYDIAYRINFLKDEINFNCSIPKYIYANNVRYFLPNISEWYYRDKYYNQSLQDIYRVCFGGLKQFISNIFT